MLCFVLLRWENTRRMRNGNGMEVGILLVGVGFAGLPGYRRQVAIDDNDSAPAKKEPPGYEEEKLCRPLE
jgi:hypothetical protein